MRYVDNMAEVDQFQQQHPDEAICVRCSPPHPWLVFGPGKDRPMAIPNGGFPPPRYTNRQKSKR